MAAHDLYKLDHTGRLFRLIGEDFREVRSAEDTRILPGGLSLHWVDDNGVPRPAKQVLQADLQADKEALKAARAALPERRRGKEDIGAVPGFKELVRKEATIVARQVLREELPRALGIEPKAKDGEQPKRARKGRQPAPPVDDSDIPF